MRSAWPLALLALVAVDGGAAAQTQRTVVELLANPAAHDGEDVLVEGVVRAAQWAPVTVLGNPPRQDLFPMFLLGEGAAALWVVMAGGPGPRFSSRPA